MNLKKTIKDEGKEYSPQTIEAVLRDVTEKNKGAFNDDFNLSFGCDVGGENGDQAVPIKPGETGHQFFLSSIDWSKDKDDKEGITYKNPWDTSKDHHMSINDFIKLLHEGGGFSWVDLTNATN